MAKKKEITIRSGAAEYLSYVASVGDQPLSVELRYEDENIWLTQRLMAELYGVTVSDINQHLKTIYEDRELTRDSTVKKFLIVQQEGGRMVNRQTDHYCLQAIIAVGFKVNNEMARAILPPRAVPRLAAMARPSLPGTAPAIRQNKNGQGLFSWPIPCPWNRDHRPPRQRSTGQGSLEKMRPCPVKPG